MKLQITLTKQEERLLSSRAEILGYDVTKYVKFLLAREALLAKPRVFQMNESQVDRVEQAFIAEKTGETKEWHFEEDDN
ncbi:hypothetical protein A3D09_02315 [Candidatus Collierbacteria bacterium RIFCSPHIGHO2_02_FULL_49_10]|uniref:Uncharacterized protein n=1 Tax=Candidatus Collierbacteria bacterium RIFCSPHIGHO2_02_FULL_49_10 TaxID=1817723 RepID=A0A1F5ER92_9BACT|nr:MAG: hypothetical protein A3D09_02315 [Candidatus Collierbacteria bacterium RIFCSPHIGHO2_02_FULL_49_10]